MAIKGNRRGAYSVLVEKPEGKRLLRKPRHRWKDNIKMYLQEVGWDIVWIYLTQDRDRHLAHVERVMKFQVP